MPAVLAPGAGAAGLQAALRAVTAGPARPPPAPRGGRCSGLPARAGLSLTAPGRCDSRRPPSFPALLPRHSRSPTSRIRTSFFMAALAAPGPGPLTSGGAAAAAPLRPGLPGLPSRNAAGALRRLARDLPRAAAARGCAGRRPPLSARAGGGGSPGPAASAASAEGRPGAPGAHRDHRISENLRDLPSNLWPTPPCQPARGTESQIQPFPKHP